MAEEAKKPGLGLLIGPPSPKGEPVPEAPSEPSSEASDLAVDGMMEALSTKDSASFKSALTTFLEAEGYTKS